MGQTLKINLLKQKKTPTKICLKTFRDKDLDLVVEEAEEALVWVEDVVVDNKTVSGVDFNLTVNALHF
jgi:hypothetical protein